jgi:hypothetical protein
MQKKKQLSSPLETTQLKGTSQAALCCLRPWKRSKEEFLAAVSNSTRTQLKDSRTSWVIYRKGMMPRGKEYCKLDRV